MNAKCFLLVIACAWSCLFKTHASPTEDLREALGRATIISPASDVESSITEGNFFFHSIQGYSERIPGVEPFSRRLLERFGTVRPFPGTTDIVDGDDHRYLTGLAEVYAGEFNTYMLLTIMDLEAWQKLKERNPGLWAETGSGISFEGGIDQFVALANENVAGVETSHEFTVSDVLGRTTALKLHGDATWFEACVAVAETLGLRIDLREGKLVFCLD